MPHHESSDLAGSGILKENDVKEFQALMRSECNVDLTLSEAWNRLIELLWLYNLLNAPQTS